MRAIVYDRYGSPDVLRLDDIATPTPGRGQVLVRVIATSVNLSDWEGLHGSPAYARFGGLIRPARRTLGSDIAGVVQAVGAGVTRFRLGDEVYGDNLALKGGSRSTRWRRSTRSPRSRRNCRSLRPLPCRSRGRSRCKQLRARSPVGGC